jgi:hypothetical protein
MSTEEGAAVCVFSLIAFILLGARLGWLPNLSWLLALGCQSNLGTLYSTPWSLP